MDENKKSRSLAAERWNITLAELLDDPLVLIHEKKQYEDKSFKFPVQNEEVHLNGTGLSSRYHYLVNINRKRCICSRVTFLNRINTSTILLRLDIDTKPHCNPDNRRVGVTHLHVFQTGFNDAWAYELNDPKLAELFPGFDFSRFNETRPELLFVEFSKLCNFINLPTFPMAPLF